jgi:response regulator NasT
VTSKSESGVERQQTQSASSLAGKRLVICEDEGITQMQLRRILIQEGLLVVGSAGDGKTAVEVALRERPEIILMDINMPGMDGLEAARLIRMEYDACIVMLTAYATQEYQNLASDIGAAGYIIKPITAQTLVPQLYDAYAHFVNREKP